MVSQRKGFCKFRKKSLGAGVSMGLEHAPDLFVRIICSRMESGFNFSRMMGIVVDDGNSADLPLVLETPVCACKAVQSL